MGEWDIDRDFGLFSIVSSHSVFIHRYRDAEPAIRSECIRALGLWMKKHPDHFLEGNHLRYVGWVLTDVVSGLPPLLDDVDSMVFDRTKKLALKLSNRCIPSTAKQTTLARYSISPSALKLASSRWPAPSLISTSGKPRCPCLS